MAELNRRPLPTSKKIKLFYKCVDVVAEIILNRNETVFYFLVSPPPSHQLGNSLARPRCALLVLK
jgi:hypothetical protein